MATDVRSNLVPKLRFSQFAQEPPWLYLPLYKLAVQITRRNTHGAELRPLTNSAEFGVIDQRKYFHKDIATNTLNYFVVEKGDYVYNPRISLAAPVGPISKNQLGTGVMSPLYIVFRFQSDSNDFFAHYFKSSHWHEYLRRVSNRGARHDRMAITIDDLMRMPIPTASQLEQQKIADCLGSLDELITATDKKLEALRLHKQGLLQHLFPQPGETVPRLRFPEFTDELPWEYFPLKKLVKRITQRNTHGTELRPLTNSAEHGVIDQQAYFGKNIATNTHNYFIVEKGDYVYNPRISSVAPVGPISKNRLGTGVMSPLYIVFRFESDENDFFAHYFKSSYWYEYLRQISNRGARHDRMAITVEDLILMPVPTASRHEQQMIADCLGSLDDLIAALGYKLETLQQHKQGLMQQLFPNLEEK